ncbi:hypothetical protein QFC22_004726 [Naganishia vaughanmartiniae]|uniref:Uncharacterized protein n=1 Tax=Naganishia vaughanmartiniae TaxID=1424756 RepID=A0ACC2WXX9_9TREE|nr:hypothetical protein QFC22_004726 [Naganishia vaughanmartiniae]
MSFPALADNISQALWTVVCVTALHIAVYRVAHKDLRVWIAVSNFLNERKDRQAVGASPQMDGPDAKSEEGAGPRYILRTVADPSERHPMMKRLRKYIEPVSLIAPLLLSIIFQPSRDPQEPEKEPDAFDRILAVVLSRLGQDLARVVQYAQIGFIFSQTVSLLRFDYGQNRDQSPPFEWEEPPSAESDKRNVLVEDRMQDPSMVEHSTSRVASSEHVFIPTQLQPFSAPTFNGSIIGSYFCFIIAVLLFPMPEQCVLWTPATFIGQSLGGALSVTWNGQWKALWRYQEVWKLDAITEAC